MQACAIALPIAFLRSRSPSSAQATSQRGRKYKPPTAALRIEVTVIRDADSKPIENASVIFQLEGDKGNMELKTNEDGKSVTTFCPWVQPYVSRSSLRVIRPMVRITQSTSPTWPGIAERPGEQYSIYKDHHADAEKSRQKWRFGITKGSPHPVRTRQRTSRRSEQPTHQPPCRSSQPSLNCGESSARVSRRPAKPSLEKWLWSPRTAHRPRNCIGTCRLAPAPTSLLPT